MAISLYTYSFWPQANSHRAYGIVGTGVPVPPGPMTESNALPRGINTQAYETMKAQIAACLLCLLVVGSFLDGLPDPPAVKPQSNPNNLVSPLHHHIPVTAKSHASDYLAGALHFQARFFSLGQVSESSGPSHRLTFVRQATDISPPWFS